MNVLFSRWHTHNEHLSLTRELPVYFALIATEAAFTSPIQAPVLYTESGYRCPNYFSSNLFALCARKYNIRTTDIKLSLTYRTYSYTIVIIITQLYENVSSVIDHPRNQPHHAYINDDGVLGTGVSVDNVSLATIIDAALNYTTALASSIEAVAAAAATASTLSTTDTAVAAGNGAEGNDSFVGGGNDTHIAIPEIPAYIRTTSMVFCITIMFLGVIGNIMVGPLYF